MRALIASVGVAVAVLFVAVSPAAADAQGNNTDFSASVSTLRAGDSVYVTDTTGREQKVQVVQVSGSILVVSVDGERRELSEANIKMIRQRHTDSLMNGVLIGAAIGGGAGVLASRASLECSGTGSCVSPIFAGLAGGALWGLVVDAVIRGRTVIYEAPGSTPAVRVAPLLGRERIGVNFDVRFRSR